MREEPRPRAHCEHPREHEWEAVCVSIDETVDGQPSHAHALEAILSRIRTYLDGPARQWLAEWKGNGTTITCPWGYVELPIDLWGCKITGRRCPIQAQVWPDDEQRFLQGCEAPDDTKTAILETVRSGRYEGGHHVPGRYLCTLCRSRPVKESYKYHYPWELQLLSNMIDLNDEGRRSDVRRELVQRGVNPAALYTALCPACETWRRLLIPRSPASLRSWNSSCTCEGQ